MSAVCSSYYTAEKELVSAFTCPKAGGDAHSQFCCGFNDAKYCCDDPNGFFPYDYGYMWWLSIGALVGLSVAAAVLLTFLITVCVLCILFVNSKPGRLDSGLPLSEPGREPSPADISQAANCAVPSPSVCFSPASGSPWPE